MAEGFLPDQIVGQSSESDFDIAGWMSPRISLSRGFVGVNEEETTAREDDITQYSSNFEFAVAASLNTPSKLPGGAMLSAEELMSDGKLILFEQSHFSIADNGHYMSPFSTPPYTDALPSPGPSLKSSRSYPPARGETNLPLSPKALKCSLKLRELFRFKTKHCQQEKESMPSEKEEKASCKILRFFSRSRSVSIGKLDDIPFPALPVFSSMDLADSKSFCTDTIFMDSNPSLVNDHEASLHSESRIASSALLWTRTCDKKTEKANTVKSKGKCSKPREISSIMAKQASLQGKPALNSSSFVRDGGKESTVRVVAGNLNDFAGLSGGGKGINELHGRRKMMETRVEYWKLADNRAHSSRVRDAPVLLNIPACIAPSLRGKKIPKKFANPRPLFLPKKVKRS